MQDYKFRAWHKPTGTMIYQQWDAAQGVYLFPTTERGKIKHNLLSWVLRRRDFVVMLGVDDIIDMHGRDVYVCDIVRRWEGDREIPPIVVEHTPKFWWNNIKTTKYEVIGNTFENPELKPGAD